MEAYSEKDDRCDDVYFSIVVPLYNKCSDISATIESVLSQTHSQFELIIIDDGSTDGGGKVVRGFDDPRIRLMRQNNEGAAAARNSGWRTAKYSIVAFLDADDRWDVDYLEAVARLIGDFPNCGGYGMGYRRRASNGVIHNRLEKNLQRGGRGVVSDYFLAATRGDQPFYTSSICIRRDVLAELDGFKRGVTHGEDLDLWGRLALAYSIAFDPTPKATYRLVGSNRAMNACPPLGWEFRSSARDFFLAGPPPIGTSSYIVRHIEHIELFHVALNIPFTSGRMLRQALRKIAWSHFPVRKTKLWLASVIVAGPPRANFRNTVRSMLSGLTKPSPDVP